MCGTDLPDVQEFWKRLFRVLTMELRSRQAASTVEADGIVTSR